MKIKWTDLGVGAYFLDKAWNLIITYNIIPLEVTYRIILIQILEF